MLPDENLELEIKINDLKIHQKELCNQLKKCMIALDDWLHVYMPEEFDGGTRYGYKMEEMKDYTIETQERIKVAGGTIAYIADIQERNREILKEIGEEI